MSNTNPADYRFFVIGCGSIGKRHISNLQQLGVGNILAFDPRGDRLDEVQEQFGIAVTQDIEKGISDNVQVTFICSPTHLHLEHALLAAEAGSHMFIEKPLSHTLDGIEQLLDSVSSRSLLALVGCNFRFHPGLRFVRELLRKDQLGTIVTARAQFGQYLPDWHPWEDYSRTYSAQSVMGGGVILDRIHEIDYMRWLFGEVTEVYAIAEKLTDLAIDVEDTVEILLRFSSGCIGSVHLDYVRRQYDCHLELTGDKGSLEWVYQDNSVRWQCAGDETERVESWPEYDGNTMYLEEIGHFLDVLGGAVAPEQDLIGATRTLELALAARESARTRKPILV